MKKVLFSLIVLSMMGVAHAGGIGNTTNNYTTNNNTTNNKGGDALSVSGSKSHATSLSNASSASVSSNKTDVRSSNAQGQNQDQKQSAHTGDNSVSISSTESQRPVSTAFAAPLTASNGSCMGSTSAGGQGVTVGLSFGTTWTDAECNRRYNSIRMQELGQVSAAIALMCQDSDVAAAMETAGTPCPSKSKTAAVPAAAQSTVAQEYQDPIIRRRLGLPPL